MFRWLKRNAPDIIIVLVGLFATLLLFDFGGRDWIIWKSQTALLGIKDFIINVFSSFAEKLSTFEPGDLFGWVFLLIAWGVVLWRARWRFTNSDRYCSRQCPKCESEILRAHRTRWDMVVSRILFLRFHRYSCSKNECGWSGLRQPGRQHKKRVSSDEFEAVVHGEHD